MNYLKLFLGAAAGVAIAATASAQTVGIGATKADACMPGTIAANSSSGTCTVEPCPYSVIARESPTRIRSQCSSAIFAMGAMPKDSVTSFRLPFEALISAVDKRGMTALEAAGRVVYHRRREPIFESLWTRVS